MPKKINIMFPENVLQEVDGYVKDNYHNRSVFIIDACKEKIKREQKK